MTPRIEILTRRAVAPAEQPSCLDVLVRITPPDAENSSKRPPLNLGFALDRSGSMSDLKLEQAKDAVCYCLGQLGPIDRASVVIFDDHVDVLFPSAPVSSPHSLADLVRRVRSGGSTALHEGWVRAGLEVSREPGSGALNRVLLVTDGLANVGETRPSLIVANVRGLRERGVSTSTVGVGDDFDENLLQAMAEAGDGNAWYVRSPEQFPSIFQTEFQGLSSLFGQRVSLGLKTAPGVRLADMLNDFPTLPTGRYGLPNMVRGNPLEIVLRLEVPGGPAGEEAIASVIRLAWDSPSGARDSVETPLTLRYGSPGSFEAEPENPVVTEAVELLMGARARREAMERIDQDDLVGAGLVLEAQYAAVASAPATPGRARERNELEYLQGLLASPGSATRARKEACYQRSSRTRGSRSQEILLGPEPLPGTVAAPKDETPKG